MSALLKKHFWAANLAAIAVLAWSASETLNTVVGTALFVVPRAPAVEAGDTEDGQDGAFGRVAVDIEAARDLSSRRIFDLRPPPDDEGGDEEEDADDGDREVALAEGELEESELPIDLLGTLVVDDVESSLVTLSIEKETKLGWVGSEFLNGKAKVVAIAPRHMILQEGSQLRVVKLWSDRGARAAAGRGGPGRTATRPKVVAGKTVRKPDKAKSKRTDYSKGVKKTGPYDYEIDRAMLDEQLQDLTALGSQARVVPNYRNGRYEGFKLVGVRPGSLYRSIGVRSGDVIKAVNSKAIDSPNKALELFEALKSSSTITLEIERRGQPKQLNYTIK